MTTETVKPKLHYIEAASAKDALDYLKEFGINASDSVILLPESLVVGRNCKDYFDIDKFIRDIT